MPLVSTTPTLRPTISTIVYQDDFSDNGSGWPKGEVGQATAAYVQGQYRVTLAHTGGWTNFLPRLATVSEAVVVEAEANEVSNFNGRFGIMCRHSGPDKPFYAAWLDRSGSVQIFRTEPGAEPTTLSVARARITHPRDAALRLKLECRGDVGRPTSIRFYVDEQQVAEALDLEGLPAGRIGLIAGATGEADVTVLFDNVVVRRVT